MNPKEIKQEIDAINAEIGELEMEMDALKAELNNATIELDIECVDTTGIIYNSCESCVLYTLADLGAVKLVDPFCSVCNKVSHWRIKND